MFHFLDDSRILDESHSVRSRLLRWAYQQPMVYWLVAAAIGILVDHVLGPSGIVVWCVVGLGCSFLYWKAGAPKDHPSPRSHGLITLGLVAAVFGLNHRYQDTRYESAGILDVVSPHSRPAIVEGRIANTPRRRSHPLADQQVARGESPWQTLFEVNVDSFRIGETMEPMSGRIRVTINGRCDHRNPGDQLRLYGHLHTARRPRNPGSRNSLLHDRRNGIHARMEIDRVEQAKWIHASQDFFNWRRPVAQLATGSREILLNQLGPTNGPLAVALITGQRDFVDNDTQDLLLVTGTAHLLSVSGMHLAIVVVLATWVCMLLRFPMGMRVPTIIAICLLYTAITGSRPPVLRATVLVSVFLVAILIRRPSQPLNTLALAGLLLLANNPENIFAVGVQLSFLAVATLLVASGRIGHSARSLADQDRIEIDEHFDALLATTHSRMMGWVFLAKDWMKTLLWLSLCVTTISLPLVWHQFHVVSPVSIMTNVILGPFLFAAFALGIATILGGMIHPVLGVFPATLCGLTIGMMKQIILIAASVPYGHAWLPAPPTLWVIVFYIVLFGLMLLPKSPRVGVARWGWISVWLLVSMFFVTRPAERPKGSIEATFVDVGHGTCVILRSKKEVWLYDCGRLGNEQGSSRDIDRALWSLGVTRIHGLILSHADSDHFNSLPGLIRRFTIEKVITPPGMLDEPETAVERLAEQIKDAGIPVVEKFAGQTLHFGTDSLKILHPPRRRIAGSDNANSLVLQWDHAGKSLVLPGDLEPPGTEIMTAEVRPTPGGILMAPHHGSLSMSADTIMHWARPRHTVVSGGRLARRPAVTQMLNQYGSDVHVTALSGAIRVRILESGEIQIRNWSEDPW